MTTAIFALMTGVIAAPLLLCFGFKMKGKRMKRALWGNLICFAVICVSLTVAMLNGPTVFAAGEAEVSGTGMAYIGAALATGLAAIGAGIGVASSGAAAINSIAKDPEIMGKALIFVALAEGIALYGLLISFTIIGNI